MSAVDTCAEAVERLAQDVMKPDYLSPTRHTVAATLRALAAERDAARRENEQHDTPAWQANERLNLRAQNAEADRDRLAAENDKLHDSNGALAALLIRWLHYGCPDCGGDCGSANPPVSCCIMRDTRAALGDTRHD